MKKIFENKKLTIGLITLLIIIIGYSIYMAIPKHNVFVKGPNMHFPRVGHTATLLQDGRVLVVGGSINSNGTTTDTAEIYNPIKKNFTLTDNLKNNLSEGYAVTLLSDGKVLISGGVKYLSLIKRSGELLPKIVSTLQVYNPDTNKFTIVGNMTEPRKNHSAILLPDGKVLIIGGEPKTIKYAEVFDPKTNKTNAIYKTIYSYYRPSAILTKEGVFITASFDPLTKDIINKSELYDWENRKFIPVGELNYARIAPNLILLKNGNILISGGIWEQQHRSSVEIYHHDTKTINKIGGLKRWNGFSAVLLKNGNVLFTGGDGPGLDISLYKTAEIYETNLETFVSIENMRKARVGHTSTLLSDGTVLITGGSAYDKVLKSSEIYSPKD